MDKVVYPVGVLEHPAHLGGFNAAPGLLRGITQGIAGNL
jgi:hypothetical protein